MAARCPRARAEADLVAARVFFIIGDHGYASMARRPGHRVGVLWRLGSARSRPRSTITPMRASTAAFIGVVGRWWLSTATAAPVGNDLYRPRRRRPAAPGLYGADRRGGAVLGFSARLRSTAAALVAGAAAGRPGDRDGAGAIDRPPRRRPRPRRARRRLPRLCRIRSAHARRRRLGARYRHDGSVEAMFIGEVEIVAVMIEICRRRPARRTRRRAASARGHGGRSSRISAGARAKCSRCWRRHSRLPRTAARIPAGARRQHSAIVTAQPEIGGLVTP